MAPTAETETFHVGSSRSSGATDSKGYMNNNSENETARKTASADGSIKRPGTLGSPIRNLKENEKRFRSEFFKKEPSLYSHQVYKHAAVIFEALKHESREDNPTLKRQKEEKLKAKPREIPYVDFANEKEKRLTFELAFNALKYQNLLEDMLFDTTFFSQYVEFREEESLVMVMLQDFQTRKFQVRTPQPGELPDEDAKEIEDAIMSCSTKLNASLARNRIRHQAASVDFLLPEAVRSKDESTSKVPVYVWVNQLKMSIAAVIERLTSDGYCEVSPGAELSGHQFWVDPHCEDVLVFPPNAREDIVMHDLLSDGYILMQDKSSCYGPHSVRALVNETDDVIHVNIGSGVTTAHLASLFGKKNNHIWAFGNFISEEEICRVQKQMDKLGAKNVKIMPDKFLDTSPEDSKLKSAKVVLVTAECSKSGIKNPVDFVVSEGEDMTILKDLSIGETDNANLGKLLGKQIAVLKHAMRMPKVQAIVYCTRSVHDSENENVLRKAMEYANNSQLRKVPYRVVPPVLPFSGEDIDSGLFMNGKFLKCQASDTANGCFVAIMTREPEEVKETAKDVLARAAAKGLLGPKGNKSKISKASEDGNDEGEMSQNSLPYNSETESAEKFLQRRVRRSSTQKSHSPTRTPGFHAVAKVQTRNLSYKGSGALIRHPRHVSVRTSELIGTRLYNARLRSLDHSPPPKTKPYVQEYRKIVRHPAPFR